nr:uncharacterized protein LOC128689857 [Cherax quadricarinatus]
MKLSIKAHQSPGRYSSLFRRSPENQCSLFRAKVTEQWAGVTGTTFIFDQCFSTFPFSGDVGRYAITASSSVYKTFTSNTALNASFYCFNEPACYESIIENGPWWRADFGRPLSISAVIINYVYLIDSNVEFLLGNDSNVGNNPVFVTQYTTTPYGGLVLMPTQAIVGRYFFVTEPAYSDIGICDVWILSD